MAWWQVLFKADIDEVHIIARLHIDRKVLELGHYDNVLLHRRANSSAKVERSDRIR